MPIKLNGSTSGYNQISASPTASNNNLTLPNVDAATVSASIFGTEQTTTSGTSKDWLLSSGVKRITVSLSNVSTNGSSDVLIQIGSSGAIESSGYSGSATSLTDAAVAVVKIYPGSGFAINSILGAVDGRYGQIILTLLSSTTNTWAASGIIGYIASSRQGMTAGTKSLAGAIDRIRLTTANGTDAFDAGSANIIAEYF